MSITRFHMWYIINYPQYCQTLNSKPKLPYTKKAKEAVKTASFALCLWLILYGIMKVSQLNLSNLINCNNICSQKTVHMIHGKLLVGICIAYSRIIGNRNLVTSVIGIDCCM